MALAAPEKSEVASDFVKRLRDCQKAAEICGRSSVERGAAVGEKSEEVSGHLGYRAGNGTDAKPGRYRPARP